MLLQQLGSRQRTEIEHGVVDRVDAVSANRNDHITVARKHFGNVIITLVTRYRLAVIAGTGPLQERTTSGKTRRVTAMQKQNDGERAGREVGRVMDRRAQFDWAGKVRGSESGVAEVVLFACHCKWSRRSRIRHLRKRRA